MTGVFVFAGVESVDLISIEDAKPLLACRGCLAASRPLWPLERALAALYGELVGTNVREVDILPKLVCSYCHALLLKFKAFRDKCRSSQTALFSLYSAGVPITVDLLPSVTTGAPYPNLQTTYIQQVGSDDNVPEHQDIPILILDEHLYQTGHQNGPKSISKNNIQSAPLHCSQNENPITFNNAELTTNTDTVNITDVNDCRDFDDSNEDQNTPNCLAGKKNTTISYKDHSVARKQFEQKTKTKIKDHVEDKNEEELSAGNTEGVNMIDNDVDNDCCDSDDSNENSDIPDCLAGFNSDIYKKDTIISFKDHSGTRKQITQKTETKMKNQSDDKSLYSDLNLDEIKQWIAKKKASKNNNRTKTKMNEICKDDQSGNVEDSMIEDKNVDNSIEDSIREVEDRVKTEENGMGLTTDSPQIVIIDSESDIDDICLADTKKKRALHGVNKKSSHKKKEHPFSLKKIKMFIDNFKHKKIKEKEFREGRELKKTQRENDLKALFEKTYNSKIFPLPKEEQINRIKMRKDSPKYKDTPFKCEMCYHTFLSNSTYQNHMTRHELSQGDFICDVCSIRYPNQRLLRKHCTRFHMFEYRCNQCGVVTTHREQCIQHYKLHKGVTYNCKLCGKSFTLQTSLISHTHKVHGGSMQCSLCGGRFIGKHGLQAHMKLTHKKAIGAVCRDCGVQFHTHEALQRHLAAGGHSHACAVCGETFHNDQLLQEHKQNEHKEGFICDLCGKTFDSLKRLKTHIHCKNMRSRSQPGAAPGVFICEVCGAIKRSKQTLEIHLRMHSGERPFQCHHCNKCFVSKYVLQNHVILKHMPQSAKPRSTPTPALQPTPCRYCNKIYSNKHNQIRHEKQVHHGMRPFTCDTCGSTHLDKSAMQMHINTKHLGMPWPKRDRRPRRTRTNYQ